MAETKKSVGRLRGAPRHIQDLSWFCSGEAEEQLGHRSSWESVIMSVCCDLGQVPADDATEERVLRVVKRWRRIHDVFVRLDPVHARALHAFYGDRLPATVKRALNAFDAASKSLSTEHHPRGSYAAVAPMTGAARRYVVAEYKRRRAADPRSVPAGTEAGVAFTPEDVVAYLCDLSHRTDVASNESIAAIKLEARNMFSAAVDAYTVANTGRHAPAAKTHGPPTLEVVSAARKRPSPKLLPSASALAAWKQKCRAVLAARAADQPAEVAMRGVVRDALS